MITAIVSAMITNPPAALEGIPLANLLGRKKIITLAKHNRILITCNDFSWVISLYTLVNGILFMADVLLEIKRNFVSIEIKCPWITISDS